MNIFWETIAQYNAGTWIYQLIITLVGLWLTYSLFHHPTPAKKKGMKLYLIFINAWVAVVYYHIYCDPRSYSNALALFWGIMCFFWIYDLIVDYTPFELNQTVKEKSWHLKETSCSIMFPPFSLPLVFCSPRHGFPHDDFSCHAMFGSSIHHRTVIGFFTTSQSFPHLILVPLGAYRFYQNLFLPDSRRFLAGKFSRTRIIPFL